MRMLGYMCSLAACHSCDHKGQGVVVHNAEFDRTAIHCTTAWVHASCGVTAVWVPTELASRIEIVNGEANLRPSARPERAVTPTRSRSRSRSRSHRGHRAGTQGYCFALPCAWWDSVARGVPCTTNWVALCGAAEFMRVTWCREGGGCVHAHGRGPLCAIHSRVPRCPVVPVGPVWGPMWQMVPPSTGPLPWMGSRLDQAVAGPVWTTASHTQPVLGVRADPGRHCREARTLHVRFSFAPLGIGVLHG